MKRKVVTLEQVRQYLLNEGFDDPNYVNDQSNGICALVSVTNMGFCKDKKTKWYWFNLGNEPCVLFNR